MSVLFSQINWLAVIAATISYSALSGIWHRQFAFGKKWETAMGFERTPEWKETPVYYIVPLIACFISSTAIAAVQGLLAPETWRDALQIGSFLGVSFATTVTFTNAVIPTMKNPIQFGLITGTAHALGITVSSLVIFMLS